MRNKNESMMIILSSPSGAGKTTISKKIQQKFQNFKISVSHTTREPRSNEVNGVDYHFTKKEDFKKLIEEDKFYEYAKIFKNYYGTSKNSIKTLLNNNNDVLFDIDWQGTQQLSKFSELKPIKIFILPPSKNELKKRLIERNQDKGEIIKQRLEAYDEDIIHWKDYDYIILNDNLEICFKQIEQIIYVNKQDKIKLN